MKILRMNLLAYGPFTDTVIDFSRGEGGLHVIYGPNEAGKSSALRALRNMLYGIPPRSSDDFIHPYSKMRIGAAIESSKGDVLEFIRRKGNRHTLRSINDKDVIEEAVLGRFLNGVDENLFVTMFGIDHEDLVHGGKEIIQGSGNMGQLIFAAGSGVSYLREVQEQLKTESDGLFKPAAKKPKINVTISNLNKNRKNMQKAQLPGQEWVNHDKALGLALDQKRIMEKEVAEKKRSLHYLERIRDAFPIIAKRKEMLNRLQTCATAILLPEEFPKLRRDRITKLEMGEYDSNQAIKNKERVNQELSELEVSNALLDKSSLIEEINRELGSQIKEAKNSLKLHARITLLREEAKEILCGLRNDPDMEDVRKLRVKISEASRIQTLGREFEGIITRLDGDKEAIPKLAYRITDIDKQLKELGVSRDIDALKNALLQADDYKVLEKQYADEQTEIGIALKRLEIELGKQTFWSGSMEKLESLPVPLTDSINIFEDKIGKADIKLTKLNEEFYKLEKTLADVEKQIDEISLKQEVPTEKDLREVREKRDQGWIFILSALNNKPAYPEKIDNYIKGVPLAKTLAEAFESRLKKADEIADRLRREADRVTAKAKLIADQSSCKKQLDHIKPRIDAARKEEEDIAKKWIHIWEPAQIAPGSPREMRIWTQAHKTLVEKAQDIRERKTRADKLKNEIDHHIKVLIRCMDEISEPGAKRSEMLADLIKKGNRIIESENDLQKNEKHLQAEKKRREQELEEAQARVDAGETDLLNWQKNWAIALLPIGLDSNSLPAEANAVLEELRSLFDKQKEANTLQKTVEAIKNDADKFNRMVANIVNAVARDLSDYSSNEAALELNSRLTTARTALSTQETLQKQLKQEESRIAKADKNISLMKNFLREMCMEAGCARYEDLPEAEEKSELRRDLETEIKELDERLHRLSGGVLIDDFIENALKIDPDSIEGSILLLEEKIEEWNQEKSRLDQTIGSERTELGKMDGNAQAADLAEEIQMLMGSLANDVEQYARLKIAAKILNMGIKRYQDKSQGPILKRAATLFKLITGGSFEGIRAEFDEDGFPAIVGTRPGGREIVDVAGMSDGTADQLYLALRIAGIQDYLEKNEPVPFIVDDILIKFDDNRAIAALHALSQLSVQTQVIFFTHNSHLLKLAEKNIESSLLVQHILNE